MFSWGFSIAAWDEDVEAIADLWNGMWLAAGMPSTAVTTGVLVRVGTSDPSAPIVFDSTSGGGGSGSAGLMSPNNSLMADKRTTLGGRKGRGRAYFLPVRESDVDNTGIVTEGYRGGAEEALISLIQGVNELLGGAELMGVLLHTSALPAPTEITSIVVDAVTSHQSRRLVR